MKPGLPVLGCSLLEAGEEGTVLLHSLPLLLQMNTAEEKAQSAMHLDVGIWNVSGTFSHRPNNKGFFSLLFSLQVNFVACQLVALCAAFWFRIYLSPGKTSPLARHSFATIFGIYFVIFCFGWWVGASSILIVIIGVFCGSILGLSQVLRKEVYMNLE